MPRQFISRVPARAPDKVRLNYMTLHATEEETALCVHQMRRWGGHCAQLRLRNVEHPRIDVRVSPRFIAVSVFCVGDVQRGFTCRKP